MTQGTKTMKRLEGKTKDLIEFLEEAYVKMEDHKLWILKDICRHHDIVMTNEWNREKNCPVFAKREIKGSQKDMHFMQMIRD